MRERESPRAFQPFPRKSRDTRGRLRTCPAIKTCRAARRRGGYVRQRLRGFAALRDARGSIGAPNARETAIFSSRRLAMSEKGIK